MGIKGGKMFGKLENNILKYAPHYVILNNKIILNPCNNDYINAGYKEIEFGIMPSFEEGKEVVKTYSEEESKITVNYSLEETETNSTTDI